MNTLMSSCAEGTKMSTLLMIMAVAAAGCVDGSEGATARIAGDETTSTLRSRSAGDIATILAAAGVPIDGDPNEHEDVNAEALSTVGVGDLKIETGDTAFGQDVLGQPLSDTTTVFEDAYPSADAVVQETAEGVRLISVIHDAAAPTEFLYTFGDAVLTRNEGTGAIEISRDDVSLGFVDMAWAVDAAGNEVPTEYEIRGSTLVQIVDHAGAQYPVVADPNVRRNCGIITCTWYFTRSYTRNVLRPQTSLPNPGAIFARASVCRLLGYAPAVAACATYVAIHAPIAIRNIREAADANKCFTVSISAAGGGNPWFGVSNDGRYCANR